jgi:hypothetical protein
VHHVLRGVVVLFGSGSSAGPGMLPDRVVGGAGEARGATAGFDNLGVSGDGPEVSSPGVRLSLDRPVMAQYLECLERHTVLPPVDIQQTYVTHCFLR